MADPTLDHIDHAIEGWDAIFNDDMDKIDANFLRSTKNASSGEKMRYKWYEITHAALAGATQDFDFTALLPATGYVLQAVLSRVTGLITGATSYSLGDTVTADQYAHNAAVAAGTTTNLAAHKAGAVPLLAANPIVRATANGGNFTAGTLKVAILVLECDDMTA